MSPAAARTSDAQVVAAGRDLLEASGLAAVTMQAVAARVGVRGPSLYKRFASRGALIAAIGTLTLQDLGQQLAPLGSDPDAEAGVRSVALVYRAFAHAHPRSYELLQMNLPPDSRPAVEATARAASPVLDLAERLVGRDRALEAARLITAFSSGFISMELAGAFRLGGDRDEAYRYGIDVLVAALGSGQGPVKPPRRAS